MTVNLEQLESRLNSKEDERLEFKEAKSKYSFDILLKYCTALANEGGGKIILGITDKRPRKVVGTQAFPQPERTRAGLLEKLPLRIDFHEFQHANKRILIFTIPSRPVGIPRACIRLSAAVAYILANVVWIAKKKRCS